MVPPVLSCCGFLFRPDVIISNGGCDSSAAESRMTEKDPKFSRTLISREPASAAKIPVLLCWFPGKREREL